MNFSVLLIFLSPCLTVIHNDAITFQHIIQYTLKYNKVHLLRMFKHCPKGKLFRLSGSLCPEFVKKIILKALLDNLQTVLVPELLSFYLYH